MEWVTSNLHTTSEHCVSSIPTITTADAHTSAASSRLNRRPCRFKWTRPFRRKTKSGFCACAITFQTEFTTEAESATAAMTSDQSVRMLKTFFVCEMKRHTELNRVRFQQDGAANQTAFACMNFLSLFLGVPGKQNLLPHTHKPYRSKKRTMGTNNEANSDIIQITINTVMVRWKGRHLSVLLSFST
jgi:hypothetical protein